MLSFLTNFPLNNNIYFIKRKFSLFIVVTGGFALINDNKITILVNEAEIGYV